MAYQEISKACQSCQPKTVTDALKAELPYWHFSSAPFSAPALENIASVPHVLQSKQLMTQLANLGQFAIAQAELALRTVSANGNPSSAKSIEDYLHFITKKQTVVHTSPKQAIPLFFNKLSKLMSPRLPSICSKLHPKHPAIDMYLRTRCGLLLP